MYTKYTCASKGINKIALKDSIFFGPTGSGGPATSRVWTMDYCMEAELTRRLNIARCPTVVKVFDYKTMPKAPRDNFHYHRILYEFCEHKTLHELVVFYYNNG